VKPEVDSRAQGNYFANIEIELHGMIEFVQSCKNFPYWWHGRGVRHGSAKAVTGVRVPLPPPNFRSSGSSLLTVGNS
jgi:hypothetical protein